MIESEFVRTIKHVTVQNNVTFNSHYICRKK